MREEERLFRDWPTGARAELVQLDVVLRQPVHFVEVVVRVERRMAVVIVDAARELVAARARLKGDCHGPGPTADLRAAGCQRHRRRLHRILARRHHGEETLSMT